MTVDPPIACYDAIAVIYSTDRVYAEQCFDHRLAELSTRYCTFAVVPGPDLPEPAATG